MGGAVFAWSIKNMEALPIMGEGNEPQLRHFAGNGFLFRFLYWDFLEFVDKRAITVYIFAVS